MIYGLWQSSAGMQVNQYRMDVLANNLANAHTTGFKADLATITQRDLESFVRGGIDTQDPVLDNMTGGIAVRPSFVDFSNGPLDVTDNPLDVALPDSAFLAVNDGGDTRYTQDGRLSINARGELVMQAGGRPVLNANGQSIVAQTGSGERVQIGADGTVRQGDGVLGQLDVVSFDEPHALIKHGSGLYGAGGQTPVASKESLTTGAIEQSNVDPVHGLASMIEVTRAYDINARLLTLQDDTLGRAVNDIAELA